MFDETKFFLGSLCKRKHEYENTGRSLRSKKSRHCYKCIKTNSKSWYLDNKDESKSKFRSWYLKNNYGITIEQYQQMYDRQGGLCAICGQPETNNKDKPLTVDHDHTTGKIRSLLCNQCNLGLGNYQENIFYLIKSILYILYHRYFRRFLLW